MVIAVSLPQDEAEDVRGLLGRPDGDPDNDLERPDTNTLSNNSDTETIFFDFGEECKFGCTNGCVSFRSFQNLSKFPLKA